MKRSLFDTLPEAIKTQIHKLFKDRNFADFDGLTEEINSILESSGFEVQFSRSTLHRQAQKLKKLLDEIRESQEASAYLMEAFPDEDKTTSQANLRLLGDSIFQLQMDLRGLSDEELSVKQKANLYNQIGLALSRASTSDITISKYRDEVKSKIEAKFADIAPRTGIDQETLRVIREEIYGIVS
jgi:hypothetical protein